MPIEDNPAGGIINESRKKSIHSFGYADIFNKRASRLSFYLNILKLFGILLPASIGITYSQFGDTSALKTWVIITWVISTILFIFSICAIAFKWDDELSYCFEASQNYNSLFSRFTNLYKFPPQDHYELLKQYDLLDTEYRLRNEQDAKHDIREHERRRGMRWALREVQVACIGCNKIPVSMESTNCPVCGKFDFKNKFLPTWIRTKKT